MENLEKQRERYGDEEVLCIDLDTLKRLGLDNQGYIPVTNSRMHGIITTLETLSGFHLRYLAEDNPEFTDVQIVPYVTCSFGKSMFLFKRVKNGDPRGDGKFSIGIGGHINPCDIEGSSSVIINSILREVMEETGESVSNYELEFKGFIRDHSDAFNQNHLGIHVNINMYLDTISEEGRNLCPFGMINVKTLHDVYKQDMEIWSVCVLDRHADVRPQ